MRGSIVQSVARLIQQKSRARYPIRPFSFVSPSGDGESMRLVLVNGLGCLGLTRNSVNRSTDRPDMTIAVYLGRKATKQQ